MMKNTIVVLGVALLMAGVVLAIAGSTFTFNSETRWAGVASGQDTTEGGNITNGDLGSATLTEKWAAYWGNVSGSIRLWDGTNSVYVWSVGNDSVVGEVCASTNSAFAFSTATSGSGADVDTAWSFTAADTDSATNTLTGAGCALTFTGISTISGSDSVLHTDSNYETCVIDDGATGAETNFAFCGVLNNTGVSFDGTPSQYELMVPTTDTAGADETFFFYLELN